MQMESQKSTVVSQNTNNILQTIKTTNQNLGIIDSAFSYSKVLSLIQDIISVKTSAVSLSEFTYSNSAIGQGDGGTGSQTTAGQALATSAAGRSMSVSGIAQTREDLVGFVKKLQDSGFFSDVVSPISDLAKDKDISFSINLNVK
jgi:hypothetical protein